ncbi:MAG: cysteine desulfurase [Bdellovibrionota bacterium]
MRRFDVEKVRADFPALSERVHGKPLVYLDNGATSQRPVQVLKAMEEFYTKFNANVHRGIYQFSEAATTAYESVRSKVAGFLGVQKPHEIIFTRGTTEAINLVAWSWGRKFIKPGDDIILTRMEHHSNFVPWQALARELGANLSIVELDEDYRIDIKSFKNALSGRPKLLAVTQMSNVLGTVNPIHELAVMAKNAGAKVLVDGAQGVVHLPTQIDPNGPIDFYVFSAHKMCGPTGVGVLWGKEEVLNEMPPFQYGGSMILRVGDDCTTWNELPWKFEAGTPNIAGVIGFGAAIDYLQSIGMHSIALYESELTAYALEKISEVQGLKLFGPHDPNHRGAVFSFTLEGVHPHDIATLLDQEGVAVRAGHHCAQPLLAKSGISATTRASLYFYNTRQEIDVLVRSLEKAKRFF